MENPATWNDTQKLINRMLYATTLMSPGAAVVNGLKAHGFHSTEVEIDNLASLVDKKFDEYNKLLATGFCGSSASRQVYSMLQQLGVVV
jgi:hypothetical protein